MQFKVETSKAKDALPEGVISDEAELKKKHSEAVEQLARYAADPNLEKLAGGTTVHFVTVEFRGKELARLEEVREVMSGWRGGGDAI